MVSRVRIAAAACLMASGLIVGGASGALAFADPPLDALDLTDGEGTKTEPAQNDGTQKPDGEQPDGEKPDGEKPDGEKPDGEEPDGEKPEGEQPDGEKPDGERPDGEEPDGEKPDGEKPDGEEPDGEEPDGEKPDGEQPDGEEPDGEKPDGEQPDGEEPDGEEPEPNPCEDNGDDGCGPGWPPWWPWPWPDPGLPPEPGGGGGHSGGEVPSGRPDLPPAMQLPPELLPETEQPAVIDAEPGAGVTAAEIPFAPITLPIIVAPSGLGGGAPRSLPTEPLPNSPRGSAAEPQAGRQPPPGETGSNVAMPPSSYRVGYTDYLRSAGLSQVVALAAPGLAGMLVLTGAGGLVGYRQAKAGHAVHTGRSARFVN